MSALPRAKVERFEDLVAWQKARSLTSLVYESTRTGALSQDLALSRSAAGKPHSVEGGGANYRCVNLGSGAQPQCHRPSGRASRQMQRAAVSTMANIAEDFDKASRAEFRRFLATSKGSCAELRSHLYVALDAGYYLISEPEDSLWQSFLKPKT